MKYLIITVVFSIASVIGIEHLVHKHHPPVKVVKGTTGIWGIDISHHQQNIDWDKVASENLSFIIMKATEGSSFKDSKFSRYRKEAEKRGIAVGAYHFFSYRSSGKEQAENFLRTVEDPFCTLLVLDVEYVKGMHRMRNISGNILEFMNVVKERTGRYPVVYCECSYYNKYVKPVLGESVYKWVCAFNRSPQCSNVIHQVTNKRRVSGFKGTVDYNSFTGTREKFNELFYPCIK